MNSLLNIFFVNNLFIISPGFQHNNQRATLGAAGHRMVNHSYAAIPPPSNNRGGKLKLLLMC